MKNLTPLRETQQMKPLWHLRGGGVFLLRDWRSALALVHYADSPVGAYDEFAVIQMDKFAPSVAQMLVTSQKSKIAGRALWGFPKEVSDLQWWRIGRHILFRKERQKFRFRDFGWRFPFAVRFWTEQTLNENRVRVPFSIRGKVRPAFRGKQIALHLEEFEMTVFAPQSKAAR